MTTSSERKPERAPQRVSLSHQGPQYFPPDFLDEAFHYRWVNYVPDKIWKAISIERMGYDPVPASEAGGQITSKVMAQQSLVKEGYITCQLKGGGQAVLMRLPKVEYLERERLKKEARDIRKSEEKDIDLHLTNAADGTKKTFSFTNIK